MRFCKENRCLCSCRYKITIASKFKSFSLERHSENIKVATDSIKEQFDIEHLKIIGCFMSFEVCLPADEPITINIGRIKRLIEKFMFESAMVEELPFFSSSFMCASVHEEDDIELFNRSLKKSYRSKGELL